MADDHYHALGVSRDATTEDIKRAYRGLVRQYHPDTNPDPAAAERIRDINAAYEVLSDPVKRERYDLYGDADAAPGFAGFGDLGDLMESFFGSAFGTRTRSRARAGGPARGSDLSLRLDLDFEEAVFGTSKTVKLDTLRTCERCAGTACEPGTFRSRCVSCSGTGEQRTMQRSIFGTVMSSRPCVVCRGEGDVPVAPCTACAGRGRIEKEEAIEVSIPAGMDNGQSLRIEGAGEAGSRGGPAGDLYVQVLVRPHESFVRDGDTLLCSLRIPFTAAALGAEVPVPTLDGDETVAVGAGTQPGATVRLRGKGVPRLGGRGRGDLIVQLVVDVPTKLTADERRLLEEFAAARGEKTGEVKGILGRIKDVLKAAR